MSQRLAIVLAVGAMIGCASNKGAVQPCTTGTCAATDAGTDAADTGSATSADTGGFVADLGTLDTGGSDPTCPDDLKQVYLLALDGSLRRFAPTTLTFSRIGPVGCPVSAGALPNAMSVDRKGIAWINYTDGSLWRVRISDAACSGTTFNFGAAGFTNQVGMAFAADAPGAALETLYAAAFDGSGVAKIDTSALTLSRVGTFGTPGVGAADLSGTGDGRLFAFFQTSASVGSVDRGSGKLGPLAAVPGLVVGLSWTFAFWGGEFWLFTQPDATKNSVLTRFDMTSRAASTVSADVGFVGVGSGVSTCAPTKPPR